MKTNKKEPDSPSSWAANIVSQLLPWYREHRRTLPWREDPTPYKVLLSEFMLQQTQVITVLPYFEKFIRRFPDFQSLAQADIQEVLSAWSGLGYYQRARNLQKTAQILCSHYLGEFPQTREEVLALPGIGPYTAGAVLSIAFRLKIPLLDGNVIRLLTRLQHWTEPVDQIQKELWALSAVLVEETDAPQELNQALMELPALLCTPKSPQCLLCPLQSHCKSRGNTEGIPNKKSLKIKEKILRHVLVVHTEDAVLLTQHTDHKHLTGLYNFPWLETLEPYPERFSQGIYHAGVRLRHGIMSTQYELYPHIFKLKRRVLKDLPSEWEWIAKTQINHSIPLTGSGKKIWKGISEEMGISE